MIYDIAGLKIQINNRFPFTSEFCKDYLADGFIGQPDFSVSVSKEEFFEEKKCSEGYSDGYSDGYIENICLYRAIARKIPEFDGFLLHSAVLDYEGEGYAFLGKSGAGKSTHTGLWLKYIRGAEIINGDKPIVRRKGENFYAYGTPWMGKEGRGKKGKTQLRALCFLEKAPENSILRLTDRETTMRLFNQVFLPTEEEAASRTLQLMDGLVSSLPAYLLKCNISQEAVKVAFEGLTDNKYGEKKL